jgi:signal transduction histidine kinase
LSYVLSESLQLERIADQIARFASRFLEADGTAVLLANPEGRGFQVVAAEGSLAGTRSREVPDDESTLVSRAVGREHIELGEGPDGVLLLPDVRVDRGAVAPLRAHGMTLGALVVAGRPDRPWTTHDLWLLSTVAMQAAVVFTNSRFFSLLQQGKEEWETTFDALSEGIALVDADGRLSRGNRALSRLAGVALPSLIGQELVALLFNSAPTANELLVRARQGAPPHPLVLRSESLDRMLRLTAAPLPGRDGAITVVILVEDVTEQRAMEAQLIQNEKMAAVGQLVSGVAHELNNPLTSIAGLTEFLLEQERVPEASRDHLRVIHDQAERASRIVRNLLTFARKGVPELTEFDLADVAQRSAFLIQAELRLRGIALDVRSTGPVLVRGDRYELQQVVLNLLTNAVHALNTLPEGGPRHVILETNQENATAVLRVSDSGPGVPPHLVAQLYTPFFTTKEPGQGTGLGLSISYGLIESHGGRITYQRGAMGGAEFTVVLPLAAPAAAVPARRRVLVADADPSVHRVLTALLRPEGHEVVSARTGEEALALLLAEPPDLVIADAALTSGGASIVPALLAARNGQRPRLLLSTAHPEIEDPQTAGLRRLTKPLNVREVHEAVREALAAS